MKSSLETVEKYLEEKPHPSGRHRYTGSGTMRRLGSWNPPGLTRSTAPKPHPSGWGNGSTWLTISSSLSDSTELIVEVLPKDYLLKISPYFFVKSPQNLTIKTNWQIYLHSKLLKYVSTKSMARDRAAVSANGLFTRTTGSPLNSASFVVQTTGMRSLLGLSGSVILRSGPLT